ncbi:MAG: inverse autotransporter beta domain-containing protein [Candidatus Adiutrix sp.]|nr:inverse autotransporter beta domain-containing protein [Candidatus Adiutrix sp.]
MIFLALPAEAGEKDVFILPGQAEAPAAQADSASAGLGAALGLTGLPGMAPATDDETVHDKAWRLHNGPNGATRLSYGERYRRNPDGSYGAQSSSQWRGGNVADRLLDMAVSAGSGAFTSWAEGFLGGYGKARLSFRINDEGQVTGSGDFLLPLYDNEYSVVFTQMGLRTMANNRVVGNFGLGQRFFPAENFALGYNAFIDQDFTRRHTRGGAGVEAWYDWLRLSANYYAPLSGWKDSEDYDSRLVEERPAEGYDARLTGYLPFYRNLALTGAFEQWMGDHVGSFGAGDVLQKDPKVWSYGLEWTPIPVLSAGVTQRHSGGEKETQFGLTFDYLFGVDWEDQLSPATVAEMRTVDGSRHDFVNRQNDMLLEYRVKKGAEEAGGGAVISLSEGLNILLCDAGGNNCRAFDSYTSPSFVTADFFSTVNLKVVEVPSGCDSLECATTPADGDVIWKVTGLEFGGGTPVWWRRAADAEHGLYWGGESAILSDPENHSGPTAVMKGTPASSRNAPIQLTDIVGSRAARVEAAVSTSSYPAVSKTVAFGDGPLSVFDTDPANGVGKQWSGGRATILNQDWDTNPDLGDFFASADNFHAAISVGGYVDPDTVVVDGTQMVPRMRFNQRYWARGEHDTQGTRGYYYSTTARLPKVSQLAAVAKVNGKGAAFAADWPDDTDGTGLYLYWSGEVAAGREQWGLIDIRCVSLSAYGGDADLGFIQPNWNMMVAVGVRQ